MLWSEEDERSMAPWVSFFCALHGPSFLGSSCLTGMRTRISLQQGLSLIRTRLPVPPSCLHPKSAFFVLTRGRKFSHGSAWAQTAEESEAGWKGDEALNWASPKEASPAAAADYLSFTDKELLAQCVMDTFRASGPGGQHRNKTDSAVRLKHSPTGLVGQASDARSQHPNKVLALNRLRQLIATKVRRPVERDNYKPPLELLRILPAASSIKKESGVGQQIGPNNANYVTGMQALLDLISAVNGSVSEAAVALGLSTGMLSKLITSDKVLWQAVNTIRAEKGLKPLR